MSQNKQNKENEKIQAIITEIYASERFGVFSSIWKNQSHQTLVCFVVTDDLTTLIFGTPKNSRKFINSRVFEKVSFFVDTARNEPSDLTQATTIAAVGRAFIADRLPEDVYHKYLALYLGKHPYLEQFITSPSTNLVVIQVDHYQVVQNFQRVIDWYPTPQDQTYMYRQMTGKSQSPGLYRGKVKVIATANDIQNIQETDLLLVDNLDFALNLVDKPFGGIISELVSLPAEIVAYCQSNNIPCVVGLEQVTSFIEPNDDLSVDGYLGILIIHKIR